MYASRAAPTTVRSTLRRYILIDSAKYGRRKREIAYFHGEADQRVFGRARCGRSTGHFEETKPDFHAIGDAIDGEFEKSDICGWYDGYKR